MSPPIHHTFGPHADWPHVLRSQQARLAAWTYKRGTSTAALEQTLGDAFNARAFVFGSGREGLLALLRAMKIRPGEEVILQGYTCVVLPNAIHAAGAVPVFADISRDTLNMDVEAVAALITPRTRAIICQHTFGIPADTFALRTLCDAHNLLLIEDCAHIIPDAVGPQGIGKYADAILLSFGRDKAISGIAGGAMLCRKPELSDGLAAEQENAIDLPWLQIAMLLQYPVLYMTARPLYNLGIGKGMLWLAGKIGALIPILRQEEKEGNMSPILHRMPNACATIALGEWNRLQDINNHRRMLTRFYLEQAAAHGWPALKAIRADLPLQKFPLFVRGARAIRKNLKRQNIHLDDGWTGCVVCPDGVDLNAAGYFDGRDPVAEAACEQILSLPTHPTMTMGQARILSEALNKELQIVKDVH